jgi:O-antigen/teichoic acid export membrane protein
VLNTYTKKVFNNFLWLIFDKVVLALVSLVVLINVANHYGPSEYGLYQYALSLNLIFGVIVLFVDGKVVKKNFSKGDELRVLFNTVIAKVVLSLLSLIIGIILLVIIDESQKFNLIYLLLLVNNIVVNLVFGIECYFDYHLKSKNIVVASNIANATSAVLQLVAVSLNFSIIAIVYVVLFSSLIKTSIIFYQFHKYYEKVITLIIEKTLIYSIIRESIPLAIAAAAAMIYARTDLIMIGSMLNMEQVGIYSISVQIMSVVIIAIVPIQVSIYPRMLEWYKESQDMYYEKYQIISSLATWLFILGAVISLIVAPVFFDSLFSDEYSKSVDVFMIHLVGALFIYNAVLRSSHFTITGYTKVLMVSQIIAVFINILLNYLLIPEFGIIGAAIATAVTQFLSLFVSNLFCKDSKNIFWIQLKGINPLNIIRKDLKKLF